MLMQATAKHKQLAFEGYCHLPEMGSKEWYWTHKGQQRGPYSVAELFNMSQGTQGLRPLAVMEQQKMHAISTAHLAPM